MPTEQELLKQLKEVESHLRDSRLTVSDLKKKLISAETTLIDHKIQKERLLETLQKVRNSSFKPDPDHRKVDDVRFLAALPDLLEKIK